MNNTKIITSQDGTKIAYETLGNGPAIILVDGALCYRASTPNRSIAKLLADRFTVYLYDRRGRGESTDASSYDPQQEINDLSALIDAAGGSAYLFGQSSGAMLALETARVFPRKVKKLVIYEAPLVVEGASSKLGAAAQAEIDKLAAANRRSDAVKYFLQAVGAPSLIVNIMQFTPAWNKMTKVAHTLPYDFAIMTPFQLGKPLPKDRWQRVTMPTIVGLGGKSPETMRKGQEALTAALPTAKLNVLPGQTHMLRAKAIAPILQKFFNS